ncbi:MAG: hypothetical protein ACXW31_05605 [Thermoanaerobaculia bacterium]
MVHDEVELLKQYAGKGILLDSNLLLLLVVGVCDRNQITRYKRLSVFAPEDFDVLVALVAKFRHLFITPHVVTEVSNLAGGLTGDLKRNCFRTLAESIAAAEELITPSRSVSEHDLFVELGMTDAAIHMAAGSPPLVLTMDFRLAQTLAARNRPVINFNHLRYRYWQS